MAEDQENLKSFNAYVDDHFMGNFIEFSKADAETRAKRYLIDSDRSYGSLVLYGPNEDPHYNGEWTAYSGRARWQKVFPDLEVRKEVNGSEIVAASNGGKAWRIFCSRLSVSTLGLNGLD